jgi:hypothetical protein
MSFIPSNERLFKFLLGNTQLPKSHIESFFQAELHAGNTSHFPAKPNLTHNDSFWIDGAVAKRRRDRKQDRKIDAGLNDFKTARHSNEDISCDEAYIPSSFLKPPKEATTGWDQAQLICETMLQKQRKRQALGLPQEEACSPQQ